MNGEPGRQGGTGGHAPVLLEEVIDALAIRADGFYVDATFGRGGHSTAILQRLGKTGELLAIDRDPQAIAAGQRQLSGDARATLVQARFSQLADLLAGRLAAGILLDLGVSSPQLDEPGRGFSFLRDGPLDMRMDTRAGETAAGWLARAAEREISDVMFRYGEERHARRIARAIVAAREQSPVTTTSQLASIIAAAVPGREPGRNPATRAFQALRILVNGELEELQAVLPLAVDGLAAGGRLAVISFHSLEDRIAKRFLRAASREDPAFAGLPAVPPAARPRLRLVGRARFASASEVAANPRARSAVLRVAERLDS